MRRSVRSCRFFAQDWTEIGRTVGEMSHPQLTAFVTENNLDRLRQVKDILDSQGPHVRLADFILRDMETILVQWEAFAATRLPASARMTPLALRDHAQPILEAVARDLSTPQTKE